MNGIELSLDNRTKFIYLFVFHIFSAFINFYTPKPTFCVQFWLVINLNGKICCIYCASDAKYILMYRFK